MSKSYDTQQKCQLVNKHFFDNRKHIVNLIVSYNFFANYTTENKYNQYLHHLHNLQTHYYLNCLKNSMLRHHSYYSIYLKLNACESMKKYVVNLSNMYEFLLPLFANGIDYVCNNKYHDHDNMINVDIDYTRYNTATHEQHIRVVFLESFLILVFFFLSFLLVVAIFSLHL